MALFKKILLFVFSGIICSCATITNTNRTQFLVTTQQDSAWVCINQDTCFRTPVMIEVQRSKKNLNLAFYKDSVPKNIILKSKLAPQFYGNILLFYGIIPGFIADGINYKKSRYYGYEVNVDINKIADGERYIPKIGKGTFLAVISVPVVNYMFLYDGDKYIDYPGIFGSALGLEYHHRNSYFVQIQFGYVSNSNIWSESRHDVLYPKEVYIHTWISRFQFFYVIKHFDIGFGFHGLNINYRTNYWANGIYKSHRYNSSEMGFNSSVHFRLIERLSFGVNYYAPFVDFGDKYITRNQHLIYFEIMYKIPIKFYDNKNSYKKVVYQNSK